VLVKCVNAHKYFFGVYDLSGYMHIVFAHTIVGLDSFICLTSKVHILLSLIHLWNVSHSFVWRDSAYSAPHSKVGHHSVMCGTWPSHIRDMWFILMCGAKVNILRLVYTRDLSHSYVRRDSLYPVPRSYAGYFLGMCETWFRHMENVWLIHLCGVKVYMVHASYIQGGEDS